MMERRHFTAETDDRHWVVRNERHYPETRQRKAWTIITWWYGPNSGWGTTSSSALDYGVQVFITRAEAEQALRSTFGPPRRWRGARPVRVADARAEVAARAKAAS